MSQLADINMEPIVGKFSFYGVLRCFDYFCGQYVISYCVD